MWLLRVHHQATSAPLLPAAQAFASRLRFSTGSTNPDPWQQQHSGPIAVETVRGTRVLKDALPKDKCGPLEDDDEDMVVMTDPKTGEWGGPTKGGKLPEPTRYSDWERKGRCSDF